ncbi:PREDICTED: follistatin-related protein 5-like, partial [Priapulus caudatus]|uniref:Follistatin-related protein 5-like n=1 Tax=Priapulus caudatus TaxID=37621 RepID=A0ABM1F784_PRICU
TDPCRERLCGRSQQCVVRDAGAVCVCKDFCKPRDKPTCGSDGVVYRNHCELHRAACRQDKVIKVRHHSDCVAKKVEEDEAVSNLVVEANIKEEVAPPPVCDDDTYPDLKVKLLEHYKDMLLDKKDRDAQ